MADVTLLVRKSSGEVEKISRRRGSTDPMTFNVGEANFDLFYARVDDPTWVPNAVGAVEPMTVVRDGTQFNGISKVEGEALICNTGTGEFQYATQAQIDTFATSLVTDEHAQEVECAKNRFKVSPRSRKQWIAVMKVLRETNLAFNALRVGIENAATLADAKAAAAGISDLITTKAELQDFLETQLDAND